MYLSIVCSHRRGHWREPPNIGSVVLVVHEHVYFKHAHDHTIMSVLVKVCASDQITHVCADHCICECTTCTHLHIHVMIYMYMYV